MPSLLLVKPDSPGGHIGVGGTGGGSSLSSRSGISVGVAIEPLSAGMKKIALTSIPDLFKTPASTRSYPAVGIHLTSADRLDSVKAAVEALGYRTFALADEIDEIETAFILMDMFLLAIGMIAIVRPDAVEEVTAILSEAGESVALLGEVIPAEGEHRVVYNGHLDLSW